MEATAGFTDITDIAAKELGFTSAGDINTSGVVDITNDARRELGLDPFPAPKTSPDFRKLFATENPFDALEPSAKAGQDALYEKAYTEPDARANAKKRVANALYLAETMHEDPRYVMNNLDAISAVYFNAKLSDADAYKRIQKAVNPDSVSRQGFLDAMWSPKKQDGGQEKEKDIAAGLLGMFVPGMEGHFGNLVEQTISPYMERRWGIPSTPEGEGSHPVLDRVYATELGQRLRRGEMRGIASGMQIPVFLTQAALRASAERQNENLGQIEAATGISRPEEVKHPDLSFVNEQQLTHAAKLLHDYAGKTLTASDMKSIGQTYVEDGLFAAAKKIGLDSAEGVPALIPLVIATMVGGAPTGAALLYAQTGAEKGLEVMDDKNMSPADKEANAQVTGALNGVTAFMGLGQVPVIQRMFASKAGRIASLQFAKAVAQGAAENEAGSELARAGSRLEDLLTGHAKDDEGQSLDPKRMSLSQIRAYSFAGALDAAGPNILTGGLLGSLQGRMSFHEQDALNQGLKDTAKSFLDKYAEEPPASQVLRNLNANLTAADGNPARILNAFKTAQDEAAKPGFEEGHSRIASDVAESKAFFEGRNEGRRLPDEENAHLVEEAERPAVKNEEAKALDPDLEYLLDSADEGGVPLYVTKNLKNIAERHGVEVEGRNPNDIIDDLRQKAGRPPLPESSADDGLRFQEAKEGFKAEPRKPEELDALREKYQGIADKLLPRAKIAVLPGLEEAIAASGMPEEMAAIARDGRPKQGFHYNGKSYLIAENIGTAEDFASAVLHEAVGHGGLKALFESDAEFKRFVDMMADYYGMEKSGPEWRRAPEERFAKDAETLAKNPERLPGALRQIWTELKLAVARLLERLGVKLRLSDSDIAAIVAKAYKAAKRGRFAEWDKGTAMFSVPDALRDFLEGVPVAESHGNEVPDFKRQSEIVAWAESYLKGKLPGGEVSNPEVGSIVLNRRSLKDSLSHGYGRDKVQALYLLPDALAQSRVLEKDTEGFILGAPVRMGGRDFVLVSVIKQMDDSKRLYVHESVLTQKIRDASKTGTHADESGALHGKAPGIVKIILQKVFSVNPEARFKEADDSRMPLKLSDPEEFDHAANYGKGLIRDGLVDFKRFEQRMETLFNGIKPGEARVLFDEALQRFHEAHGRTKTVADIADLISDPDYAGDYQEKGWGLVHRADDMPRDPRARRLQYADAVELKNVLRFLDDALKKSSGKTDPWHTRALRSIRNDAERALHKELNADQPHLPFESVEKAMPEENARLAAEADAKADAKAAKKSRQDKEAERLKGESLQAFIAAHADNPEAVKKEIFKWERFWKEHTRKQKELADFDRWLYERNLPLWTMINDHHIYAVRPPEGSEGFEGSSYISRDAGRTADEVAAMMKMDMDTLLDALRNANEKELWKEFRADQRKAKDARKPGHIDDETLHEAAKDGLSEADLLRDEVAAKDKQLKTAKKGNVDALKALGFQKAVSVKLRANKYDTIDSLRQLEKELNEMLPPELRGKYAKQFVRLAEASPRPSKDGGSTSARALLLDSLSRQILKDAEGHRVESSVDSIHKMLNVAKLRKDASGKPVGKFDPATTRRIDKIREIVDLIPEQIDARLEEIGSRLEQGDYLLEPDSDKPQAVRPEDSKPETEADLLIAQADLNAFGKLLSKSAVEAEDSAKQLKKLMDDGRTYYEEAIRDDERKQIADAEELLKQVSGGALKTVEEVDKVLTIEKRNVVKAERASRPLAKTRNTVADIHRRNLSWEWLLNSLVRLDKLSGTLKGFIKSLSVDAHIATNKEERGFAIRSENFLKAFQEIFDCKSTVKYVEARRKFNELRKETGIKVMRHFAINAVELGETQARQLLEWHSTKARTGKASPVPDVPSLLDYQAEALRQQLKDSSFKAKRHLVQHEKEGALAEEDAQQRYNRMELNGENPKEPHFFVESIHPTKQTYYEEQPLTMGQALYLWLASKRPESRYKMHFKGWTPDAFAALDKFVSPEAKRLGEWMRKEIAADRPNVDAEFQKCYHVELGRSENYFPLKYDKPGGKGRSDNPTLGDGRPGVSSINPGSFIATVHHHAELARVDAIDQYLEHIAQMEHFKAWGTAMRRFRGIFSRRATRLAIEHYVDPEAYQAVTEKLNHFADGGNRNVQSIKWLDNIRNRSTIMALGSKLSVAVQQLLSFPMNSIEIGARNWLYYTLVDLPQDIPGKLKPLIESDYFKKRWGSGFDRDLISYMYSSHALNSSSPSDGMDGFIASHMPENWRDLVKAMPGIKDAYTDKAAQLVMLQIRAGDAFSILSGGYAVYKFHLDQAERAGIPHEEAHK